MNPEQASVIAALHAADITQTDWYYPILRAIHNQYARGYLEGRKEGYHDFDAYSEEGRELLIKWAGYNNIWRV